MRTYNTADLLYALTRDVRTIQQRINRIKHLSEEHLLQQPSFGGWSIAQVLEHLNSYNRYYLAAIERVMKRASRPQQIFVPGWLGNYFTAMMQPAAGGTIGKKYTAPKDHTPKASLNSETVLAAFEEGTETLLHLLAEAGHANLSELRIPITLSRFIRLKLGDTFRFLIAHQQRHFIQIENIELAIAKEKHGRHADSLMLPHGQPVLS